LFTYIATLALTTTSFGSMCLAHLRVVALRDWHEALEHFTRGIDLGTPIDIPTTLSPAILTDILNSNFDVSLMLDRSARKGISTFYVVKRLPHITHLSISYSFLNILLIS